MKTYDVVIVGGGMVGATLAVALKATHYRVLLVDAALPQSSDDERLIALNDASVALFENMGIWPTLKPNAAAIKQVHVSHKGRFGVARIDADLLALSALGYVVPAKYINATLQAACDQTSNLVMVKPAKLISLVQQSDGVVLSIATAAGVEDVFATYVVGADGSYSTVRELLSMPTEIVDYQQSALVTVTELKREHHHIAYERFIDGAAIAMLPLAQKRVATIWTANHSEIVSLLALDDEAFLSKLQQAFGYRLGKLQRVGKRAMYPLKMIRAKQQYCGNVWLVGNAAHTLHPIAAQGLNLALYEVAIIAQALIENTPELVARIDKQQFSLRLSHHLTWLFSSDGFVVTLARQMGILGLDVISAAKKSFAKKTTGRGGYVPPLLLRNHE